MDTSVKKAAEMFFRPEFLNRLESIEVFNPLLIETLTDIVAIPLKEEKESYEATRNLKVVLGKDEEERTKIYKYIAKKGYAPKRGARPIDGDVETYFVTPIVDFYKKNVRKINEKDIFQLSIPEGCVMNKIIQPSNLEYRNNGAPEYKIACCLLKEEIS